MIKLIAVIDAQGLVYYCFNPQNLKETEILNENLVSTTNTDSFKIENYGDYQFCVVGDVKSNGLMEIFDILKTRIAQSGNDLKPLLLNEENRTELPRASHDSGYDTDISTDLDKLLTAHLHAEMTKPTKQVLKFTKKVKKPKQKQDSNESLDFSARNSSTERKVDVGDGFQENNQVKDLAYEKKSSSLFSFSIKITEKSIEKPLEDLLSHLVSKNIASQVAKELIDKLRSKLLQESKTILQPLNSLITSHLRQLLSQTLSLNTNLIHEITSKRDLYTICFVGVNGVGKSTNLSKIAYYLISNNLKVLIAACDTFRSGAVEQLKVHARNLNCLKMDMVEVFDKGYGKDPSGIAGMAIDYARKNGFDVVLVDTAGRMQDNLPLLKALAKVN